MTESTPRMLHLSMALQRFLAMFTPSRTTPHSHAKERVLP
jgi:hypothetical protein